LNVGEEDDCTIVRRPEVDGYQLREGIPLALLAPPSGRRRLPRFAQRQTDCALEKSA